MVVFIATKILLKTPKMIFFAAFRFLPLARALIRLVLAAARTLRVALGHLSPLGSAFSFPAFTPTTL